MADMHPHRRAQLELELAHQVARSHSANNSSGELAAATVTHDAAMRATATGANREQAGDAQLKHQPQIKPGHFTRDISYVRDVAEVQRAQKSTMRQKRLHLRAQIKEADLAGNYALAHKHFDELTILNHDAKVARKNDVQRTARLARRKIDRRERKEQARANGTYMTKMEMRAARETRVAAKADSNQEDAARQKERSELMRVKREEARATVDAVKRYRDYRKQYPAHFAVYQNPDQYALKQDQQHRKQGPTYSPLYHKPDQHALKQNQQVTRFAINQQFRDAMPSSYHSEKHQPAQHEPQYARFRHAPFESSLGVKLKRIIRDNKSADEIFSNKDGGLQMEGNDLPLDSGGRQERQHSTLAFHYQKQQPAQKPVDDEQQDSCSNEPSFQSLGDDRSSNGISSDGVDGIRTERDSLALAGSGRGETESRALNYSLRPKMADFDKIRYAPRQAWDISISPNAALSGNSEGVRMEDDYLPLEKSSRSETESSAVEFPLRVELGDYQVSEAKTGSARRQVSETHSTKAEHSPMPQTESFKQQYQRAWPVYGDGSKAFLDPSSTAYKIMSRMGWAQGEGLGKYGAGPRYSLKPDFKRDRKGVRETQAVAPTCQEAYGTASIGAGPSKSVLNPQPLAFRIRQNNSEADRAAYEDKLHQLTGVRRAIVDCRAHDDLNLAADEEDPHHQMNNNRRNIIDLTQDDAEPQGRGSKTGGPDFVDLTVEHGDQNGPDHSDDCMIVDSTSSWDKS